MTEAPETASFMLVNHNFNLHFWKKINLKFLSAPLLLDPFLASVTLNFRNHDARITRALKRSAHGI